MITSDDYDLYFKQALHGEKDVARLALKYATENMMPREALLLVYVIFGPAGGDATNSMIDSEKAKLIKEGLFEDREEVERTFSTLSGELYIVHFLKNDEDPTTVRWDIFSRASPRWKKWYEEKYGKAYFEEMLEIPSAIESEDTTPAKIQKGISLSDVLIIGGLGAASAAFVYLAFKKDEPRNGIARRNGR